nr:immunoglobulin heavy chain junction region [Mus musculus]
TYFCARTSYFSNPYAM